MQHLVVDTNIIISALLKDSLIRNLIRSDIFDLYSLFLSQEEVKKYMPLIIERTGITKAEIEHTLSEIYSHITLMNEKTLGETINEACSVMDTIDAGDSPFLALALVLPVNGIWSDDKHFQKQRRIKAWTTKQLIEEIISDNISL